MWPMFHQKTTTYCVSRPARTLQFVSVNRQNSKAGETMTRSTETIRINVRYHEGRYYISSDDIEGLFLCSKDPLALFRDIAPAICFLYKHNHGRDVKVTEPLSTRITRFLITRLHKKPKSITTGLRERYHIYTVNGVLTPTHG